MKQVDWNYCYYHRQINPHTFKCTWLKEKKNRKFFFFIFTISVTSNNFKLIWYTRKAKSKEKNTIWNLFCAFCWLKERFFTIRSNIIIVINAIHVWFYTLLSRSLSILLRGLLHVINIDNCLIYASRIDKNQILWARWCQKARNKHLLRPNFDLRSWNDL